ncbi:MAG: Branched-chain-amino-acid aminotransferase [Candidatus Parcubacteria bacterium]|jgi:branched-chain amino acid aminotransferase
MSRISPKAFFEDKIIPIEQASLSVASSAVLYGLSVYTVFPLVYINDSVFAFRLEDHFNRLINSAKIIGIDTFESNWTFEKFREVVSELVRENKITKHVFVRATVHVSELVAGTKSRGLKTILSIFIYDANPIIPQGGARLKTSVWRRVPDYAIPSRAKVNGAYVNSVLGKQDAIDSGYDDCLFLDAEGHVCELSAANIFIVRNGVLVTPPSSSDILEGINRKTILEIAKQNDIEVQERVIDLTELYVADEVFACGTSSYVAPVVEIDARKIGRGENTVTKFLKEKYEELFEGGGRFKELFMKLD